MEIILIFHKADINDITCKKPLIIWYFPIWWCEYFHLGWYLRYIVESSYYRTFSIQHLREKNQRTLEVDIIRKYIYIYQQETKSSHGISAQPPCEHPSALSHQLWLVRDDGIPGRTWKAPSLQCAELVFHESRVSVGWKFCWPVDPLGIPAKGAM